MHVKVIEHDRAQEEGSLDTVRRSKNERHRSLMTPFLRISGA